MSFKPMAALSAGLMLAGCASAPKPCTAEWIDWRKDRLFRSFASQHTGDFDTVRQFSRALSDEGERPSVLQMASLAPRMIALVGEFVEAAEPEVRAVYDQCGTGPRTSQLFLDLLRREGVDETLVASIEDMGLLLDGSR